MAKKSSKTTKKKGAKGKRARAKAKIERQWGEEAVEDFETAHHRRGQQRRGPSQEDKDHDNDNVHHQENEEMPSENFEAPVDQSDEEQDDEDIKAVSSFVDELRQKHRKQNRPSRPMEPSKSEEENMDDDDEDSKVDKEGDAMDTEQLDPFTARFATSAGEEDLGVAAPEDPAANESRKAALPFIHEGTMLQLSKWPPLESIPSALPSDRKAWRRYAKRLWHSQKPLLRQGPPSTATAQVVYPLVATYMDICQTIPQKHETFERLYASHILNHVWTSRQRIYQHSKEWRHLDEEDNIEAKQDPKFLDQGFTRPTVLVLMPTRGTCYQFVQTLLKMLCGDDDSARGTALTGRFVTEYGPPEEADTDARRQDVLEQKGEEWTSLFGDQVNDDDDFKLGVALHLHEKQKRPTLKLYTDFNKSDLIVASPLGLKVLAAKASGDDEEDQMDGTAEGMAPDYFSSIEICWVAHANVLMMQNWDHVMEVLAWLNQRPKETVDTDFARVRPYFLEDNQSCAAWRQFILTSPFLDPTMKAVFGKYAESRAGAARLTRKTIWSDAVLTQIAMPTRQVFQRIIVSSVKEQADARLEYFGRHVLPKIEKDQQPFTLIFVPSYFEFVSLRNYLLKREADYFVSVTEYSRHTEVSRGRARFGQGRKSLMLYTGRAHFFHRHLIRGVRHVIWYGLPEDPSIYRQVVDWCQDESTQTKHSNAAPESSVLALYTAYEAHALQRIVGHAHCSRMTKGSKTTFLFAA